MRQSMGHIAFASWSAMLEAAAESVACLSAIDGELSMTQRKSTFTARASRAARSSASVSAATTRTPVDLVIAFIVLLLLPAARRSRVRRRWSAGAREVPRKRRRAAGCERASRTAGTHDRVRRPCATREAHVRRHGSASRGTLTPDTAPTAAFARPRIRRKPCAANFLFASRRPLTLEPEPPAVRMPWTAQREMRARRRITPATAGAWLLLALLPLLSHRGAAQVAPTTTLSFNSTADTYVDGGSATTN